MSRLLVVVKSHLFPQSIQLNREIGTGRGYWGDRRLELSIAGGRALHSGATWSSGSRVHHDGRAIHRKQGGGGSYSQL